MKNKTIKPDLYIVAVDETEFWNEECQAIVGKIAGLYLVDASVHVHICSFTPSLELWNVGFITEKFLEDDNYDVIIDGRSYEPIADYYGLGVLNNPKLKITEFHVDDFPGYDDQELYNEWFADIVEYYQCNEHAPDMPGWKS